jgi:hypothetical protein
MAKLQLSFACGVYDRMLPLYQGEVQPDGTELNFMPMDGSYSARMMFDRMGGWLEFEASEISSAEFICRHMRGDSPLVAIPVFPSRLFRHDMMAINPKSGIESPKDLEDKRVGAAALHDDRGGIRVCCSTNTASICRPSVGWKASTRSVRCCARLGSAAWVRPHQELKGLVS